MGTQGSFFTNNSTIYAETNPAGPADAPLPTNNTSSPSSFFKGTGGVFPQEVVTGIQAFVPIAHQWLTGVATSGVFSSVQPAFTDISGVAANAQIPVPTLSALGGVEAINAVTSNWISYIDTSGVPHLSQPTSSDISGLGTFATQNYAAPPAIGGTTPNTAAFTTFTATGLNWTGALLQLTSANSAGPQIQVINQAADNTSGLWNTYKYRGAAGPNAGDSLGGFNFGGLDSLGTSIRNASQITSNAVSVGTTYIEGNIKFRVTNSTGTLADRVTISGSSVTTSLPVSITDTTASTLATNGSFTTAGGAGIVGQLSLASTIQVANIAAPATPASGKTFIYVDSTNLVLSAKNASGTISNTVVPSTAAAHQFATAISTHGIVTWTQPAFTDISGTVAATQLPTPTATTLGGIESIAATASKWVNAISTAGVPSATQPAFTDISGNAALAQGGLGGSQAAATVGQVPTFPGSSGAAIPRLPVSAVSVETFGAACDGTTIDTVAIQAALNSGAQIISIPLGKTCAIGGSALAVPANVTLVGPGTLKLPTVTQNATGTVALNSAVIPMTNTTGITAGMFVSNKTLGISLPGTVSSVIPGVSITMTVAVGNMGTPTSVTTNASTAAGSSSLSITAGILTTPVIAQFGMSVFDVTQARQLPGTVSAGTPYSTTTVGMSAPVGGAGVGSGDVLTFGYPVTSGDVLVFSTYRGLLVTIGSGSVVSNLTIDAGNFDGGLTNYGYLAGGTGAIGAYGTTTSGWAIDHVSVVNAGRFGFIYADAHSYRITNSSVTVNTASDKNGNEAIYSFAPASSDGTVTHNTFTGVGTDQLESNLYIAYNDISGFKYGAGITAESNANCAGWLISHNILHDSIGIDSNQTAVEGMEIWAFNCVIDGNIAYRNAGAGLSLAGGNQIVTNNLVYDNSQSAGNPGIWARYGGSAIYQNNSGSIFSGNFSGNLFGSTQTYGYLEQSASLTGIIVSDGNSFPANISGPVSILSSSTVYGGVGLTQKFLGSTSGSTSVNASAVASGVLTLPAATDTLVGKATTDTLTNKTLTSPSIATPTITGAWAVASSQTIGPGGTGSAQAILTLNGGSAAGGGGILSLAANGVPGCDFGTENAIFGTGSNTKLTLYSTTATYRIGGLGAGTVTTDASGNLSITSDETLKTIHGPFSRGLHEIKGLKPVLYSWLPESGMETEGVYAGFSAQDVQRSIPEAIGHLENGKLTLQDRPIIATLVNAVAELSEKIDELTKELSAAIERIAALEVQTVS